MGGGARAFARVRLARSGDWGVCVPVALLLLPAAAACGDPSQAPLQWSPTPLGFLESSCVGRLEIPLPQEWCNPHPTSADHHRRAAQARPDAAAASAGGVPPGDWGWHAFVSVSWLPLPRANSDSLSDSAAAPLPSLMLPTRPDKPAHPPAHRSPFPSSRTRSREPGTCWCSA